LFCGFPVFAVLGTKTPKQQNLFFRFDAMALDTVLYKYIAHSFLLLVDLLFYFSDNYWRIYVVENYEFYFNIC